MLYVALNFMFEDVTGKTTRVCCLLNPEYLGEVVAEDEMEAWI